MLCAEEQRYRDEGLDPEARHAHRQLTHPRIQNWLKRTMMLCARRATGKDPSAATAAPRRPLVRTGGGLPRGVSEGMDGGGPQRSRSKERSEDAAVKGTASGHPDEHGRSRDSFAGGRCAPVDLMREPNM